MRGPYTRGGDLARDVVDARQARPSLLSEAADLLDELRRLPADTAADVLLVALDAAGSFGRIAESRAERARQHEAEDARASALGGYPRSKGPGTEGVSVCQTVRVPGLPTWGA